VFAGKGGNDAQCVAGSACPFASNWRWKQKRLGSGVSAHGEISIGSGV